MCPYLRGEHRITGGNYMLAMASQSVVEPQETEMLEVNLYIRGYCVYKAVLEANCVNVLRLKKEDLLWLF